MPFSQALLLIMVSATRSLNSRAPVPIETGATKEMQVVEQVVGDQRNLAAP